MNAYRLQGVLSDLAGQGITADKLTAAELTLLVRACDRCDNPYSDINAELCEQPVKVCKGVYLWPVTAGANIWLTEYAEKWWPKGTGAFRWAQIYACYNARNPDAFASLTSRAKARLAVLACVLRIPAHMGELVVALNRCYGVHPDTVDDPHAVRKPDNEQAENFAHFVAMLEVQSGIPAKKWLWGKSLSTVMNTYYKMTALASAFGGGKAAEDMTFELNDALKNLANVTACIVERVKKNEQDH